MSDATVNVYMRIDRVRKIIFHFEKKNLENLLISWVFEDKVVLFKIVDNS